MPNNTKSTPTTLDVVYEDNHIIVVNKKSGDIVQGDKTGDTPLSEIVQEYLKVKYNKPGNVYIGVVHRLDRPTTGLVLFAKTSKALPRLNKMFAAKTEVQKTYWALVKNAPPKNQETLTHYLVRNPQKNKSFAHRKEVSNSKKAILDYTVIQKLDRYYVLAIQLHTGRHHQIRAQLSAIGCPIKGDLKYGFDRSNKDASISLHARALKFIHPVSKKEISLTAPLPTEPTWQAISI